MKRFLAVMMILGLAIEANAFCVVNDFTTSATTISVVANSTTHSSTIISFVTPQDPSGYGSSQIKVSEVGITARNFATSPSASNQPITTSGAWEFVNLTGLKANTQYWVAVKLVDGCGRASAMSNVVSFTTSPAPPPPPPTASFTWGPLSEDMSPGYRLLSSKLKYATKSRTDAAFSGWEYTSEVFGIVDHEEVVFPTKPTVPMYFIVTLMYVRDETGETVESDESNEVVIEW